MQYFSKIRAVKETDEGTDLIIHIPDEWIKSKVMKYSKEAEIKLNDGRTITPEQRKKIYATIRDITLYTGDAPEYMKEFLKYDFCQATGHEYFSLSNCSIETAKNFITHIIDFVLRENIPLTDLAVNRTEDIDKYLYSCIKYRRCAITGRPNADIHHCKGSRIGMGRNRKKIDHSKLEIIALSREWHTKVHQEGEEEIFKTYKIYGITVDHETLKELGLTVGDLS